MNRRLVGRERKYSAMGWPTAKVWEAASRYDTIAVHGRHTQQIWSPLRERGGSLNQMSTAAGPCDVHTVSVFQSISFV